MKGPDLLKLINDIDDDLIDRAARKPAPKKPGKTGWIIAAACATAAAAVILTILLLLPGRDPDPMKTASQNSSATAAEQTTTMNNQASATTAASTAATDAAPAVPKETETPIPLGTDAPDTPDDIYPQDTEAYVDEPADNYIPDDDNPIPPDDPVDPDDVTASIEYRVISIEVYYDDEAAPEWEEEVIFWQSGDTSYIMDSYVFENATVFYEDGTREPLSDAFYAGHVSISDMDYFGITYYVE